MRSLRKGRMEISNTWIGQSPSDKVCGKDRFSSSQSFPRRCEHRINLNHQSKVGTCILVDGSIAATSKHFLPMLRQERLTQLAVMW